MGAEKYVPKVGDRVRVVLEGEVQGTMFSSFQVGSDAVSTISNHPSGGLISVEKVEPPVEVFGPGDVVRHKRTGGLYAIPGEPNKVLVLANGKYQGRLLEYPSKNLTSENYERVELK